MRFNSKSITLNRGVNFRLRVNVPSEFPVDQISYNILESAIQDFNDILDKRRRVKEIIDGIDIDILRLGLTAETFYLWVFIKENDIDFFKNNISFTFSGKLVYGNDNDIFPEKVIIEDLIYKTGEKTDWKSVFISTNKKELTSA